ncbi:cofactor-independent phosphoglycerate mutase [candidate division KSB1 bacterium]|nr:cofactor-independent phosphoglycerate mutase [candidate division KSB1 bacterium]
MKSLIILGDGMADEPVPELDGKTPLQVADTPAMNWIAREGRTGLFETIAADVPTGSAVANLSVLGYDPRTNFNGRGVLEAASLGIVLAEDDLAMRVNLINVTDGRITSHSAGHISDEEAKPLIHAAAVHFKKWDIQIHQGLSYRHVLILPKGNPALICTPPHDYVGEKVVDRLIQAESESANPTADLLNRMIAESMELLKNHPINHKRMDASKLPANCLWPWSPGRKPVMRTFQELYGIRGAAISAVDLIKGLASYAGMDVIHVDGATGLYDTNYEGKADAALKALKDHDFVYVHVEAPDEAGHEKDLRLKIRCIEDLDKRLIQRILNGLGNQLDETIISVLPDHPTPVSSGTHTRDPIPVAIRHPGQTPDSVMTYDEVSVKNGALGMLKGDMFIHLALGITD